MRAFFILIFAGFVGSCAQRLDEFEIRIEDLDERARILESRSGLPVGSDRELLESRRLADVRTQLSAMRNDLTVLQGEVESIQFENRALRQQLEATQRDMLRLGQAAQSQTGSNVEDPELKDYREGLRLHQNGDFAASREAFRRFLQQHANSQWADNALYWVGEGLMAEREYQRALVAFQDLIAKYKDSDKKCDAMARQVEAFRALGKEREAQAYADVRTAECRAE